jgi:hypothetical protein
VGRWLGHCLCLLADAEPALGLGLLAGVESAETEVAGATWGAALATVGEGEGAEIGAVLWGD